MNSTFKGKIAEEKAVKFLQKEGFKIIERNFYTKFGEIDIIAFKDNVFHFIEVKSGREFEPIYNITPSKLKKIINSVYIYIQKNSISLPFCIDAIIIKNDKVEFIKNITL